MKRRVGWSLMLKGATLWVALICLAADAGASQLVTFKRGQSIVVQSAEKRGTWYFFLLEGGGEMGIPAGEVSQIEEYEAPPPAAPAAAGPPATSIGGAVGRPLTPQPAGTQPVAASVSDPAAAPDANPDLEGPRGMEGWRQRVSVPGGPKIGGRLLSGGAGAAFSGAKGQGGRNRGGFQPPGVRRNPPGATGQQEQPPQQ